MQIKIKFPAGVSVSNIQPFFEVYNKTESAEETHNRRKIGMLSDGEKVVFGYRANREIPIVSIEKRDEYILITIDAEIIE